MTGDITINETNARIAYGIILHEGSAENLVQFPSARPPEYNDWQEEDGIEVDLTKPTFEAREVSLRFATCRTTANVSAFITALTAQSQLIISVPEIGVTRTMRFVECTSLTGEPGKLRKIDILFIEDNPLHGYEYANSVTSLNRTEMYFLTTGPIINKPLKDYNIIVLEGSDEQLERASKVKQALLTSSRTKDGQQYDILAPVKFREKSATLKLLILTETPGEFNQKIDSFFYDLMRPGLKTLLQQTTGNQYQFFYNRCRAKKVSTYKMTANQTGVWCEIELEITITNKN